MALFEEVLSRKVGHKEWESRMLKHMAFTPGKSRAKVWHMSMNGNVAEVKTGAFPGNPHGQADGIGP